MALTATTIRAKTPKNVPSELPVVGIPGVTSVGNGRTSVVAVAATTTAVGMAAVGATATLVSVGKAPVVAVASDVAAAVASLVASAVASDVAAAVAWAVLVGAAVGAVVEVGGGEVGWAMAVASATESTQK